MGAEHEMARATLEDARTVFLDNVRNVSIEEALDAAGGFRSVMGLIKHTAGWTEVYRSYAFDAEPRHWKEIDWPRGLRETIDPSEAYLRELTAWFDRSSRAWIDAIRDDVDLGVGRPRHADAVAERRDVVLLHVLAVLPRLAAPERQDEVDLARVVRPVCGDGRHDPAERPSVTPVRRQYLAEVDVVGHGLNP